MSFQRAVEALKRANVAVSDAQKLRLYGLYKQATLGDCKAAAPSAFRPVEKAKWTSWQKLQGVQASEAKRQYLELVQQLVPSFKDGEMTSKLPEQPTPKSERLQTNTSNQKTYSQVLAQCLAVGAVLGALLFVVVKVALPLSRHFTLAEFEDGDKWSETIERFSSLLWFAVGYSIVVLLRSTILPWEVLSVTSRSRPRRTRRRRRRAPVESEIDVFLRKHNIQVVEQLKGGKTTPRLELKLPSDPDAFQFGHCKANILYTVEQTTDVYYRKFKEPLPDPASRLLDSITVLEERKLDQYCAVFKRRLLRFRNEAPALIKRFASSDFIEYVEDSLLDKQNQMFYVYVKNESFQSLGILEDYSVYHEHAEKTHWTELNQFCRVHITSSSLSFFRSRIEAFISNYYCKNAPDARAYHLQRISEEFGEPDED